MLAVDAGAAGVLVAAVLVPPMAEDGVAPKEKPEDGAPNKEPEVLGAVGAVDDPL